MNYRRIKGCTRREFLGSAALSGTAIFLGLRSESAAAEPPAETKRIRLVQIPGICIAPMYVAEELLRSEGFNDVQYVKQAGVAGLYKAVASGEADIAMAYVPPFIMQVDASNPVVLLAGVHIGCYELFGTDRVSAIRDLKGKQVAVPELGGSHHVFLASMIAYTGLDARKDINWVTRPPTEAKQLLAEGNIDAYLGFPPDPQELRAKKIGRVLVNSAVDRPWSQYFCCFVAGHKDFIRKNPVATKRALRAILKADQVCALEPDRAARLLVDKAYTKNFDYAFQAMKEIPYGKWREYDSEDTVRFYSLRLQEVGMIKSSPKKIIDQGTDWRFIRELKKELKG